MTAQRACGMACRYLDRGPEKLVIEGFRRFMTGYDRESATCWELAAELYVEEIGASDSPRIVAALARWIGALRSHMDRPATLSTFGCPRLCRDECFAVSMIAACQSRDAASLEAALAGLVRPEGVAAVRAAAKDFAAALAESGHFLIPVPAAVIGDIASRPGRERFH
ncbi:hypothetical protein [Prosthecomicrobium pneumaticum]|uniref:Uncharacterized protein n=1 Tax=Prosthecomicrobium pneumaticum TaxID=81895 RepID=A0A7W9L1L0_9HYPH|nr:hypothetical protein [Prosthecomicrobium pneumaticum]MBB5752798.1 hypothetical protein [Prosthecomicrobium pneumaticum]